MRGALQALAPSRQRGVGMIEVLIAIVVVALGVLAIIRMQTNMVRTNQSALMRSQATLLVYDMTDRLRVDRQSAIDGLYNRGFDDAVPGGGTLLANETAEWLARVAEYLPQGAGAIASNGNLVTVSVRWDDSRGEQPAQVFSTSAEI
ncbi:type IV pilus modification protein PilV [Chromatocurvus halotolerans]|uniref:Type IV pilus assembly protein PilV n=1 Tax=Chromatocurvus halotolerans TaxID=1132028 RepID=A0A4R2L188_9GAMM|nr:type IV pilus modification protein PilV [Chromatocurvus halotolerans]TCO76308.1 type IV pilus assembly protein PilV [Chromatocurvus halotolerans]